jgi:hypothetical protein
MHPLNPWLIECLIRERRRDLESTADRARIRAQARQDRLAQPLPFRRSSHPGSLPGRLVFHLRWRWQHRA